MAPAFHSGEGGAKIIADHVVAAPSIPFPLGFGAKMKVATPFPFPVWGARGATYSISALLAPNKEGYGRGWYRPSSRTGSAYAFAAYNCPYNCLPPRGLQPLGECGVLSRGGGIRSLQHRILQHEYKSSILFRRGLDSAGNTQICEVLLRRKQDKRRPRKRARKSLIIWRQSLPV